MTTTTATSMGAEVTRSESPAPGQSAAAPPSTVPYAPPRKQPHVPLRERINLRMVIFILAVTAPVLAVAYMFVNQWVTGGVTRSGDYLLVDLKALGNFVFDQSSGRMEDIPDRYRALDGKKVRLQGFMFVPNSAARQARRFQFVYDVNKCCFNGPPQVQERVFAQIPKGSKNEVYPQYQFSEVTGVLHVRVVRDDSGAITSVYDMDVESTKAIDS